MTLTFPRQVIRPPKLGSTKNQNDPMIVCKFFDKEYKNEWYVIEGEEKNGTYLFYGYVIGDTERMEEFTLQELEARKTVERSVLFKPCPLSWIKVSE